MLKKLLSKFNKKNVEESYCSITYAVDLDNNPQLAINVSPGREMDFVKLLYFLHSGQLIDLTKAYIEMVGDQTHMTELAKLMNVSLDNMIAKDIYADADFEDGEPPLICPTNVFIKQEQEAQ